MSQFTVKRGTLVTGRVYGYNKRGKRCVTHRVTGRVVGILDDVVAIYDPAQSATHHFTLSDVYPPEKIGSILS